MRYTSSNPINQNTWEPLLKKLQHRPIKPSQRESIGFSAAFGFFAPKMMSHELQNYLFISLTVEEKKLQKNKLKRLVAIRKREFAKQEKREISDLSKEERAGIKESVETRMLKDIVPDESYINAFLDTKQDLIYIDVASPTKVKRLIDRLAQLDKGFEARPFFDASLEVYLTQWLYDPDANMPQDLCMNDEATLRHDDKSKAVFTNQELDSKELITLINHDKKVIELALLRSGRLKFKLKSDGSIRKLKPTDLLMSDIDRPENPTSIMQDIEADWIAMANEIDKLYQWMEQIFEVNASLTDTTDNNAQPQSTLSTTVTQKEELADSIDELSALQQIA